MVFATYFNRKSWIKDTPTMNEMESLTDQSFKADTEIETLLINYRGTPRTPVYDMENYETSDWTFEDWQNQKALVERKFLHLSDDVKAQFGYSPAEFFKYASDPSKYELVGGKVVEKEIIEPGVVVPQVPGQTGEKTGQTTEQKQN